MDEKVRRLAQEALERAEAATEGPWTVEVDGNDQDNIYGHLPDYWIALLPHQCLTSIKAEQEKNAAFIASARTDLPALARAILDDERMPGPPKNTDAALAEDPIRVCERVVRDLHVLALMTTTGAVPDGDIHAITVHRAGIARLHHRLTVARGGSR